MSEHFNNGVIICQKLPGENYRTYSYAILMKEGYTAADLHKQISSAMPEYYFKYREKKFDPERDSLMVGLLLVFLLLGSGVLIISLSGFLKMQLQLFSLRSREMALRRTMGAKPRQLFIVVHEENAVVPHVLIRSCQGAARRGREAERREHDEHGAEANTAPARPCREEDVFQSVFHVCSPEIGQSAHWCGNG